MELSQIINNNKKTIIFEDTGLNDRSQINNTSTDIKLCLDLLSKYSGDIIVISRSDKRMEIFEEAINNNVTIDFVSIGTLRNKDISLEEYKEKIILFDKCFDGMTSITNNTFVNIKKISDLSKKFIGIDTIGTNFLYMDYFPVMLNLIDVDIELENINKEYLNKLLLNNMYIISNGELLKSINKNYWFNASFNYEIDVEGRNLTGFDVSKKLISKDLEDNRVTKNNNYQYKSSEYGNNYVLVNKYLYIFLAFFLGSFGIHKFYEKKYKKGLLYLIFCWTYIPMIISIVEAIKAIGINTDEYGRIHF